MIGEKDCLRYKVDRFVFDDKRRGEYNRGISKWTTNLVALTTVAEQAQNRFRNIKETLDRMGYCRLPHGRGDR